MALHSIAKLCRYIGCHLCNLLIPKGFNTSQVPDKAVTYLLINNGNHRNNRNYVS
jgi:hypothetical protein